MSYQTPMPRSRDKFVLSTVTKVGGDGGEKEEKRRRGGRKEGGGRKED